MKNKDADTDLILFIFIFILLSLGIGFGLQMIFGWMCIPLLNEITSWGLCLGVFISIENFINAVLYLVLDSFLELNSNNTDYLMWFIFTTSLLTFFSSVAYIILEIMDSKHRSIRKPFLQVSLRDEVNFENVLRLSDITKEEYDLY